MGTVERLKVLTLMTYADISAVNPSAMTPWRAEQLWQLYLLTYNELTRELETRTHRGSAQRTSGAARVPGRASRRAICAPTREAEIDAHMGLEAQPRARRGGGHPHAWIRPGG